MMLTLGRCPHVLTRTPGQGRFWGEDVTPGSVLCPWSLEVPGEEKNSACGPCLNIRKTLCTSLSLKKCVCVCVHEAEGRSFEIRVDSSRLCLRYSVICVCERASASISAALRGWK